MKFALKTMNFQTELLVGRLQMIEHWHTYDILKDGRRAVVSTTTVCQVHETAEAVAAAAERAERGSDEEQDEDEEMPPAVTIIEMVSYYDHCENAAGNGRSNAAGRFPTTTSDGPQGVVFVSTPSPHH